ncbi:helix-turn-helix transcriptional regulator [Actinomadura sp. 6K520]|uniref:helix-turn-helix domain-containing protein n=1 Tax=Actinomadura sp. 6K520 TaxID=2530364 RepID=UPI00104C601B|nr:helix-turn-helix transcriptional regulator [Actinomadura sp. 6K520]TDE30742.1 XRE family transcriptional regulator [Actinomadura sp. 6K520]
MAVAEDTVVRNRALQAEWYGEPLGDRVRPLLDRLGLSQSGLAGVLGLSAPMLSQLMSGQRAKISNPAVLHRLMAVEELVAGPAFGALTAAEIKDRLAEIRAETATTTTSNVRVTERGPDAEGRDGVPAGRGPAESARLVQTVLREVASAAEIEAAAALLADRFPDLAEVLRVYGNGRASEAEAHFIRKIVDHARSR